MTNAFIDNTTKPNQSKTVKAKMLRDNINASSFSSRGSVRDEFQQRDSNGTYPTGYYPCITGQGIDPRDDGTIPRVDVKIPLDGTVYSYTSIHYIIANHY